MQDTFSLRSDISTQEPLRPNISSFLYYYVAQFAVFWLIFYAVALGIFHYMNYPAGYIFASLTLVVIILSIYIFRAFRYEKEKYIFQPDCFIYKGGGIMSDMERELVIKNVTHVKLKQPFLEDLLFKTGSVHVQSAGAMNTEIHLRHIDRPVEVYESILKTMRSNGFALTRERLVQEERPHSLAVFFEVFQGLIGGFVIFLFFFADFFARSEFDAANVWQKFGPWIMLAGIVVLGGGFVYAVIHFMDLKRRLYRLYDDTVEYTEGFLNKERAVIPMENLSDSEVFQSFVSKMFNLYDIKLSCQGSSQEISFKNIQNGKELSDNIDRLISQKKSLELSKPDEEARSISSAMGGVKSFECQVAYDREYQAEFRMKPLRVWLPLVIALPILIVLFPVLIMLIIGKVIEQNCNKFFVKEDGFAHHYQFLSGRVRDFSLEKITGITFHRGIWDRLLGSCSIIFWSIGSGQSIVFKHIPYNPDLKKKILAKKGMRAEEELYTVPSKFSVADFFLANIKAMIFFIALFIVLGFTPIGIGIVFAVYAFLALIVINYKLLYYQRSKMVCYRDFVHFQHGLFQLQEVFSLYNDIKDITTLRYPMSSAGNLQFNVAGETINPIYAAQMQKNPNIVARSQMMKSNQFVIRYVKNIPVMDEMIDTIFYKRPNAQEIELMMRNPVDTSFDAVHVSKPAVINTLFGHLCWIIPVNAIIFFMIWIASNNNIGLNAISIVVAIDMMILGGIVAEVLVVSNRIQDYRVLQRSGIFFKKQTSVTFNKIDFINMDQKLLNKMFGNGNVSINTVGSSKAELLIRNIPDYRKFYDMLKKRYQGRE